MEPKNPEDKLRQFLAAKPTWQQKLLQLDFALSRDELLAWQQSEWWWKDYGGGTAQEEFESILRRIPSKWREYRKRWLKVHSTGAPSAPGGAPRKDRLAEDVMRLHQAGMSHAEIANQLAPKYTVKTKKGLRTPTRESVRKLLKSRKRSSSPDKT
jgi:hypothetical protein